MMHGINAMFVGDKKAKPMKPFNKRNYMPRADKKALIKAYRERCKKMHITQAKFEELNGITSGSLSVWICEMGL